jgi:hypothetical protein
MKPVLDWVKSNVLIVVLGVVAIGSLVAGWLVSSSMSAEVRAKAQARAGKLTELTGVERGSVTLAIPGSEPTSKQLVVNQKVLDEYQRITGSLKGDADGVHKLALERNRGRHQPVMSGVFPQPPADKRSVIAFGLHKQLVAAYEALLRDINAGSPPPNDDVGEALSRRESQFVESTLKKASRSDLDAKELADLREDLARSRLAIYGEHAQKVSVYAELSALDVPLSPENRKLPSMGQLFDWQWKYWITSDILRAIADASAGTPDGTPGSVIGSPVKRVLSLRIPDGGFGAREQPTGSSFGGMGFGSGGGGGGEAAPPAGESAAGAAAPAGADAALTEPQIDLTQEASRDYKRSFTGRTTNPIYDVRLAYLTVVVETARMPELFDALARRNFMTVLDVKVRPADPFLAASEGFIYGKNPVSEVDLVIESVWLREWTAPLMPAEVRTALGVGSPAAAPSEAPAS